METLAILLLLTDAALQCVAIHLQKYQGDFHFSLSKHRWKKSVIAHYTQRHYFAGALVFESIVITMESNE